LAKAYANDLAIASKADYDPRYLQLLINKIIQATT